MTRISEHICSDKFLYICFSIFVSDLLTFLHSPPSSRKKANYNVQMVPTKRIAEGGYSPSCPSIFHSFNQVDFSACVCPERTEIYGARASTPKEKENKKMIIHGRTLRLARSKFDNGCCPVPIFSLAPNSAAKTSVSGPMICAALHFPTPATYPTY